MLHHAPNRLALAVLKHQASGSSAPTHAQIQLHLLRDSWSSHHQGTSNTPEEDLTPSWILGLASELPPLKVDQDPDCPSLENDPNCLDLAVLSTRPLVAVPQLMHRDNSTSLEIARAPMGQWTSSIREED